MAKRCITMSLNDMPPECLFNIYITGEQRYLFDTFVPPTQDATVTALCEIYTVVHYTVSVPLHECLKNMSSIVSHNSRERVAILITNRCISTPSERDELLEYTSSNKYISQWHGIGDNAFSGSGKIDDSLSHNIIREIISPTQGTAIQIDHTSSDESICQDVSYLMKCVYCPSSVCDIIATQRDSDPLILDSPKVIRQNTPFRIMLTLKDISVPVHINIRMPGQVIEKVFHPSNYSKSDKHISNITLNQMLVNSLKISSNASITLSHKFKILSGYTYAELSKSEDVGITTEKPIRREIESKDTVPDESKVTSGSGAASHVLTC